jgi:hypothetical protein
VCRQKATGRDITPAVVDAAEQICLRVVQQNSSLLAALNAVAEQYQPVLGVQAFDCP